MTKKKRNESQEVNFTDGKLNDAQLEAVSGGRGCVPLNDPLAPSTPEVDPYSYGESNLPPDGGSPLPPETIFPISGQPNS